MGGVQTPPPPAGRGLNGDSGTTVWSFEDRSSVPGPERWGLCNVKFHQNGDTVPLKWCELLNSFVSPLVLTCTAHTQILSGIVPETLTSHRAYLPDCEVIITGRVQWIPITSGIEALQ